MTRVLRYTLYISLLSVAALSHAATIADKHIPDSYPIGKQPLLLNGAGIRSKFFIKVYVGALYLQKTSTDSSKVLSMDGPKSMHMLVLYKSIEAKKIANGWRKGFKANLQQSEFRKLEKRLDEFNALFPDLQQGDLIAIDYEPETGTQLSINKRKLGIIEGRDFFTALLKVWIGEHPADKKLKAGILGQ